MCDTWNKRQMNRSRVHHIWYATATSFLLHDNVAVGDDAIELTGRFFSVGG
jgi:hypothetical protein